MYHFLHSPLSHCETEKLPASKNLTPGLFDVVGNVFGVAIATVSSGDDAVLITKTDEHGVDLPKDSATTWSKGDRLWFDTAASEVVTSAPGAGFPIGKGGVGGALNGQATGRVHLTNEIDFS